MVFKMRTLSLARTKEDLLVIHDSPLKRFSWRELKLATDSFSNKNVVGRGGFGSVYKGLLGDGSLVAIKRCTRMGAAGAELQFQSEVEIGGSQASDHPNVLRLLGYCMTRKERLLVYPFMVNRSVNSWLRDRPESQPPLDWPTRKRIALGASKGLAHFHSGSAFTVIHRDVKAANILLDDQFEAVVCDFGLVKFIGKNGNESKSDWVQRPLQGQYDDEVPSEEEESDHCFTKSCWNFTRTVDEEEARGRTKWSCWVFTKNEVTSESGHSVVDNIGGTEATYHEFNTHVTTAVRGTIGHIAPEYLATGKCSVKNDVFGYGVMLLELVTGQRAFDLARLAVDEDVMLLDWVKQLVEDDKLDLLVDPNLKGDSAMEEMKQLIQLALSCIKLDPVERPVMSQVIKIIESIGTSPRVDQPLGGENNLSVQQFTLPQIKLATYNFSSKNIIGKKSKIGNVYRGRLKDGTTVVIKRLVKRSKREMMKFQAAVKLGGIRHPNLLQLRGYCISGTENLLVYPFMPNRSLEWRLRPERSLALDWHARKKIALGVAKGIAYLHYDCESRVSIQRDVKPYNILLGEDFNPVLCNLRLQSLGRDDQDSGLDHADAVSSSSADDVYGYGITLFVLISGKVSTGPDNIYNNSVLHHWFKKLRYNQLVLLLDSRMHMSYDMKDEIEQFIQVALLCTQPSPKDRPEMWQVMQMLQGISEGDLKVCFAFDRANMFRFDESLQNQLVHEVDIGETMDLPKLDSDGSVSSESDQTNEVQLSLNPKQDGNISSKGKEIASFSVRPGYSFKDQLTKSRSKYKGITISDNFLENWKIFLSEVVSDALPTKSKLCESRTSVDSLCPMCNEYEEENFHLFFNCDFSRQAWLLAVGVRIDMFGFGSVKKAVDMILKPNGAGLNIIPRDMEPTRFSHKGVTLMHSIWTHRNQVCSDNVSPNVIQMLKDHQDATHHLYSIQPPLTATQLIKESETATQKEFEAGSNAADGWETAASDLSECESSHEINLQPEEALLPQVIGSCVPCKSSREINPVQLQPEEVLLPKALASCGKCESSQENEPEKELITPVIANCVHCQSSREIKLARLQPEEVLHKVIEPGINNNRKHYLQVNIITSGDHLYSFTLNKPSVLSVVLVSSLCMNLVFVWFLANPRYWM